MNIIYPAGIPHWTSLDDTDFRWMLLTPSYVPDRGHSSVDDLSASELTDGSYGRETLTGSLETIDSSGTSYDADNPTWTALAGGEDVGYVAMFHFITNDTLSVPMYLAKVKHETDGSNYTPLVSSLGLVVFDSTINCGTGMVF